MAVNKFLKEAFDEIGILLFDEDALLTEEDRELLKTIEVDPHKIEAILQEYEENEPKEISNDIADDMKEIVKYIANDMQAADMEKETKPLKKQKSTDLLSICIDEFYDNINTLKSTNKFKKSKNNNKDINSSHIIDKSINLAVSHRAKLENSERLRFYRANSTKPNPKRNKKKK